MGFNPYRKFKAKPVDYVFVATAFVAMIGAIAWTLFG
jgi:hypothetical protein